MTLPKVECSLCPRTFRGKRLQKRGLCPACKAAGRDVGVLIRPEPIEEWAKRQDAEREARLMARGRRVV